MRERSSGARPELSGKFKVAWVRSIQVSHGSSQDIGEGSLAGRVVSQW